MWFRIFYKNGKYTEVLADNMIKALMNRNLNEIKSIEALS